MATTEKVVAFLGPVASYTHQATLNVFPDSSHTKIVPQTTIQDVFAAVQSRTATHGIVPFENSSNGSVVFTLDLFADLQNQYPDVLVCGETYIGVRHCLVGHLCPQNTQQPSASKPDLSHITKLYSHPQAWGQCKRYLSLPPLKGLERQDCSSTSKAAELIRSEPTSAAISSSIAASTYNLDILAEGIEDNAGNSTRFLVISLPSTPPPPNSTAGELEDERYKTLLTFTLTHEEESGSLATCLGIFQKWGLNLTSINTRPSGEAAWHYIFFVEFVGRKRGVGEGEDGGKVDRALAELGAVAKGWRWLGSWESKLVER